MTHEEMWQPIDLAAWEMGEAFRELPDADVWKRAHPRLLSIGENTAHVANALAKYLLGDFATPLRDDRFRY